MGILALLQVAFLLVVSLATLGTAGAFAVRPGDRLLSVLRPLSLSLAFGSASTICAGLALALTTAADTAGFPDGASVRHLLAGCAEAFVPSLVCFAVLALAWALAAVGFRRQG